VRRLIGVGLTVPGRILLFCLASDTDWQAANISAATAQQMFVRGLIERETGAISYRSRLQAAPLTFSFLPWVRVARLPALPKC
jgi:hypothetical protein